MIRSLLFAVLAAAPAAAERSSAVLITLDAVRADRVGTRRDGAAVTPVLDALGARGALFEAAYAQAPWTVPSLASLLTSRYVEEHRAALPRPRLDPALQTIVSALRAAGYRTAAFVSGAPGDRAQGLTSHFETAPAFGSQTPDMAELVERAQEWIAKQGGAPYFVWIHAFNTHLPYACPQPYRDQYDPGYDGALHRLGPDMNPESLATASLAGISKFIYHYNGHASSRRKTPHYAKDDGLLERVRTLGSADVAHFAAHYDGCLNYSDAQIGRLEKFVAARPKAADTLWVVTADHGEYLGAAAWTGEPRISHPFADLHEELLRVPLIVSGAGLPPARVSRPVELVDVAPTVLALLGVAAPSGMRGRDLFPDAAVPPPAGAVYSSDYDPDESRWVRTIRAERWKLVRSTDSWGLYDVNGDAGERVDVSRQRPREFLEAGRGLLEFGSALGRDRK